jgi:membrane-bound serine protease (ClpP class)
MDISFATSRRFLVIAVLVLIGLASTVAAAFGQGPGEGSNGPSAEDLRRVEVLPLRGGFLDPPVAAQIDDVLELAAADGSELVVLQYSAPGGVSVDAERVVERIRESLVPVAVLIGPLGVGAEAAGVAGLLWLAADVRAVAVDATVGPLEPLDLAAEDSPGQAATLVSAELERIGADPDLLDTLLTEEVTAEQLEAAGAVSLSAQGIEPLLVDLDGRTVTAGDTERTLMLRGDDLQVRFHSLGLVRRVLHAATTGPFIYLLLVVGLGLLLFELFQPGFGVAGIAGIITLAIGVFGLAVLPVVWWAVALVVLGLLLYALDTAMAGFGPLTLAATAALATGSWFFYAADALALPWWLVVLTTLSALVFFVFVLTSILRAQAGPEGVAVDDLVGRPGIVRSVLNPEGHVYIDGALWRARWTGDTRRAKVGTPVVVHGIEGSVVLVEPFDPTTPRSGDRGTDEDAAQRDASTDAPSGSDPADGGSVEVSPHPGQR